MTAIDQTRERAIHQAAVDESLLDQSGSSALAKAQPARSTTRRQVTEDKQTAVETVNPAAEPIDTTFIDTMDIPGLDLDMTPSTQATAAQTTTKRTKSADQVATSEAAEAARAEAAQQAELRAAAIARVEAEQAAEVQAAQEAAAAQHQGLDPEPVKTTENVVQFTQPAATRRSLNEASTEPKTTVQVAPETTGVASTRRPLVSREIIQRITALNALDADSVEAQLLSLRDSINQWEQTTGVVKQAHLLNLAIALAPILEA